MEAFNTGSKIANIFPSAKKIDIYGITNNGKDIYIYLE